MTNPRNTVEGAITTTTYAHLWHASKCVLTVGRTVQAGCTWQFLSSILLTSLAFEAYLNHIGNIVFKKDEWNTHFERQSPIEKLEVIYKRLEIQVHSKQELEAFQTVIKLFNFRNNITHENVAYRKDEASSNIYPSPFLQTLIGEVPEEQWEALTSDDRFASKVRREIYVVVKLIHKASGSTLPILTNCD
jgi:hypothetical protein